MPASVGLAPVVSAPMPVAPRVAGGTHTLAEELEKLKQVAAYEGFAPPAASQPLAWSQAFEARQGYQGFYGQSPLPPYFGERASPSEEKGAEEGSSSKLAAAQARLAALLKSSKLEATVEGMVRAGEIDSSFQYVLLTALADAEAAAVAPRASVLPALLKEMEKGSVDAAVDRHLGPRDVAAIPELRAMIDAAPRAQRAQLQELMTVLTARAATWYEHARTQLETLLRLRAGEMAAALDKMVTDGEIGSAFFYLLSTTLQDAEASDKQRLQAIHEQLRAGLAKKAIKDAYASEMKAAT